MLIRRNLLIGTAALVVTAPVLADCGGSTAVDLTPAAIITQATAIVTGLSGMYTQVVFAYPLLIPAAAANTVAADLTTAVALLGQLNPSLPATAGASLVQKIEGFVNDTLSALSKVPAIPAPYSSAIGAANIIIPGLEAFVNLYIAPAAAAKAKITAPLPAAAVDQAVKVLQSFAS